MLHTKFQAPEPSSSGEEDFEVYFIFEPKTPRRRAISDPRATIRTNLVDVHLAMLHTKYQGPRAILKILSVCGAPIDPPKSPRPKFFFRYFRFLFFFRGFRALRPYAENRHQRCPRTSKIISVCPDSKAMSYIPISFRMINSCQNKYIKCIS